MSVSYVKVGLWFVASVANPPVFYMLDGDEEIVMKILNEKRRLVRFSRVSLWDSLEGHSEEKETIRFSI